MTKEARIHNCEKTVSSVLLGKLDSYLQKNEKDHSHTIRRNKFKIN